MKFEGIINVVALVIIGLLWFNFFYKQTPTDSHFLAIQHQNDSLRNCNNTLEQQIQSIQQEADRFQQQAKRQQQLMHHLKTQQNEKMQAIHDFSGHDLYQFFARYKTAPSKKQ